MRKILSIFLAVCLLTAGSAAWADYWNEGNSGTTEDDAYLIDSIDDLKALRDRVNAGIEPDDRYYRLETDMNLTELTDWEPIGTSVTEFDPAGTSDHPFKGHFNGNNHLLYVNITRQDGEAEGRETRNGIFWAVNSTGVAIKNLKVDGYITGNYVGGIAVDLLGGTIDNCKFTGTIEGYYPDWYYGHAVCVGGGGGIVCHISGGLIKNCSVTATVKGHNRDYDANEDIAYAGGIAAYMDGGSIQNCEVLAGSSVSAYLYYSGVNDLTYAGGIVGYANLGLEQSIKNCTFDGTINSKGKFAGGIVAYLSGGTISGNSISKNTTVTSLYIVGGIAGRIGAGSVVSSNSVVTGAGVTAFVEPGEVAYSIGGIIGLMNAGTVKDNTAYATLSGTASYIGGVIGKVESERSATITISENEYSGATYGIGFDASGFPSNEGCINASEKVAIKTTSLKAGIIKAAYSVTIERTGGASPYTWAISSGKLPAGLTLNKTTGKLSGKPTKAGTFNFTVKVTDKNKKTATKAFTLKITQPSISGTLNNGIMKASYSGTLKATGGTSAYTWTISSGKLPTGLVIGKSNGKITGTPTAAGTFNFTVKVTDKNGATATKSYKIEITKPVISGTLKNGIQKAAYSATLKATGGTAAYTWSISSGALPKGMTLNKTTGKISGTPTATGTFKFTVKVTDKNKVTATKVYTLKITKTTIGGTICTGVIEGYSYSSTLTVSGGTAAYKWTISKGKLPTGLKLTYSGTTATISGTPTKAGTFSFTVKVTDKNSVAATKAFSVYVVSKSLIQTATKNVKSASATVKAASSNKKTSQSLTAAVPNIMTNNPSAFQGNGTITLATTLSVASDDVVETYEGKDSDLVKVKANTELTFIIGEWGVDVSELTVYVDDKPVEGLTVEEGKFTLTPEMVHDDFKVSVKAQSEGVELESEEVYIISE